MTLRARLTLITCLTVAVAVVAVSLVGYAAVRRQMLDDIDHQLRQRAEYAVESTPVRQAIGDHPGERAALVPPGRRPGRGLPPADPFADPETSFQVIRADGTVLAQPGGNPIALPVDQADEAVASKPAGSTIVRDVSVDGGHERLLTMAAGDGVAVQVSRTLDPTDDTLRSLTVLFALVGGVVIAVAVTAGFAMTRRSLRPIGQLTDAAEQVARTQDLSTAIDVRGSDEVGRLATSFNQMLAALAGARAQLRRLVADASHELRTPLTSLRTNIEVLSRAAERGQLDEPTTSALMADVRVELEALSTLVAEIVDLAGDVSSVDGGTMEPIDLGRLVTDTAQRAARRHGLVVDVRVEQDAMVTGVPALLERAVSNLLENAAKWDRSGAPGEVTVRGPRVEVRDHGPGLGTADAARVFDRFYRGPDSQAVPGSGLGLAIVKQVVERHGGRVEAADAPGGGACIGFELGETVATHS
jgi:two-component system sensor histidine kinase MprB